jgi:hypothetical protein
MIVFICIPGTVISKTKYSMMPSKIMRSRLIVSGHSMTASTIKESTAPKFRSVVASLKVMFGYILLRTRNLIKLMTFSKLSMYRSEIRMEFFKHNFQKV